MANHGVNPGDIAPITTESIPDASSKVFLITGAASGIGLATVRILESKNVAGIIVADFKKPSDAILSSFSKTTVFVQTDVTSWKSISNAFQTAIDRFGTLHGVYANAGIGEIDHLFVNKIDEANGGIKEPNYAAVDVNIKGVLNTLKLAVYWFRKLGVAGTVVMTSSMSGYETPGIPIYVSSKHGVIGILRAAHLDLFEEYKIRLNVVAPGPVLTNLGDSFAARKPTKYDALAPGYEWETQGPEPPALAASHLLLTDEEHGKSILVHAGRFRDLEAVYNGIRDELLGGNIALPTIDVLGWRNLYRCVFD